MKTRALGLLIFALMLAPSEGWAKTSFEEAGAKYASGDFKGAALLYGQALQKEDASAAAYYNYGNASFRAGQKGKALVAYERALLRDPRDADTRWNLNVLKSALPDHIEDVSDNVFFSSARKGLEYFTVDEAAVVFAALLGLLALLALLNWLIRPIRKWTGPFAGFLTFLWLVSGALFFLQWLEVKDPRLVVLQKEAPAYYGPSSKETKAFTLHEGGEGKVLDETKDWYYIVLKNKNTGWISKSACEII